jgi:diaminopimelate decarboxylase
MPAKAMTRRLALFPQTAEIVAGPTGSELAIDGLPLSGLAREYGTPLYLYNQDTLDAAVSEYREALANHYPGDSGLAYAGKAFLCLAMAQWVSYQDLWLDCTGVGELHIAAAAGLPRDQTLVHGVNKSKADLVAAVAQASILVVDNLSELDRLRSTVDETGISMPALWLRFRPGLAVDTHAYVQTGQDDSKFGMDAAEIEAAARLCRQNGWIVEGLHFHLGSHFSDPAPVAAAIDKSLELAAVLGLTGNWTLSPGGGLAVAYNEDELPQPSIQDFIKLVAAEVTAGCRLRNLPLPRLQLEPGRSLVARAGVALYRLGTVKRTAGRRWLLLDGGLADNPRPALYGARYSALPVHDPGRDPVSDAWLAGPYCESGDVLIEKLPLPELEPGELLAIPASGAYQLSMASNYNGARRPAVLWLAGGVAHLIQERQTPADLIACDRPLPGTGEVPGT